MMALKLVHPIASSQFLEEGERRQETGNRKQETENRT
jgi:hypothetical protein